MLLLLSYGAFLFLLIAPTNLSRVKSSHKFNLLSIDDASNKVHMSIYDDDYVVCTEDREKEIVSNLSILKNWKTGLPQNLAKEEPIVVYHKQFTDIDLNNENEYKIKGIMIDLAIKGIMGNFDGQSVLMAYRRRVGRKPVKCEILFTHNLNKIKRKFLDLEGYDPLKLWRHIQMAQSEHKLCLQQKFGFSPTSSNDEKYLFNSVEACFMASEFEHFDSANIIFRLLNEVEDFSHLDIEQELFYFHQSRDADECEKKTLARLGNLRRGIGAYDEENGDWEEWLSDSEFYQKLFDDHSKCIKEYDLDFVWYFHTFKYCLLSSNIGCDKVVDILANLLPGTNYHLMKALYELSSLDNAESLNEDSIFKIWKCIYINGSRSRTDHVGINDSKLEAFFESLLETCPDLKKKNMNKLSKESLYVLSENFHDIHSVRWFSIESLKIKSWKLFQKLKLGANKINIITAWHLFGEGFQEIIEEEQTELLLAENRNLIAELEWLNDEYYNQEILIKDLQTTSNTMNVKLDNSNPIPNSSKEPISPPKESQIQHANDKLYIKNLQEEIKHLQSKVEMTQNIANIWRPLPTNHKNFIDNRPTPKSLLENTPISTASKKGDTDCQKSIKEWKLALEKPDSRSIRLSVPCTRLLPMTMITAKQLYSLDPNALTPLQIKSIPLHLINYVRFSELKEKDHHGNDKNLCSLLSRAQIKSIRKHPYNGIIFDILCE